MDAECAATSRIIMPYLHPDSCSLEQNGRVLALDGLRVAAEMMHAHRKCDRGVDVILGRTGRKVAGPLLASNRAPGIERADRMIELTRVCASRLQRMNAPVKTRPHEGGRGHLQYRQSEHLR